MVLFLHGSIFVCEMLPIWTIVILEVFKDIYMINETLREGKRKSIYIFFFPSKNQVNVLTLTALEGGLGFSLLDMLDHLST